jgi:hypothetical protein
LNRQDAKVAKETRRGEEEKIRSIEGSSCLLDSSDLRVLGVLEVQSLGLFQPGTEPRNPS